MKGNSFSFTEFCQLRSRGVLQYAPWFVMVMNIAVIRLKWNRAVYFSHVVFLCYFLLDQKVAKESSRTEAVSGISRPAWYLFHF
jgi:hypothetical protein